MLYLFNTNIIPNEAVVRVKKITKEHAVKVLWDNFGGTFESAIGHESTAKVFGDLLGTTVPVNRAYATPKSGDVAISLKLNGRLPEGQVLGIEDLEQIGFELFQISFYDVQARIFLPSGNDDCVLVHRSMADLYSALEIKDATV